jgi:hypothetical protein
MRNALAQGVALALEYFRATCRIRRPSYTIAVVLGGPLTSNFLRMSFLNAVAVCILALSWQTTQCQSIDAPRAKAAFAQAKELSDRDGGHLWGIPLYGPLIFVSPVTREAIANQPDGQGLLHEQQGAWIGTLPPDVVIANTATHWAGKHWTMIMWPLPNHSLPRGRLLAHEMFHRLQDDLHLPANNPQNPQLDTLEGRYWIQLEWRALAAALIETGTAQSSAIRDALAFRSHRHQLFPGSADSERLLEMNEGLAEYTGYALFATDATSARWRIVNDLVNPQAQTFVRSFAYISGPAYGLLLDERSPDWRKKLSESSDLGVMLGSTVSTAHVDDVDSRAVVYGSAALRVSEEERATAADAERAHYQQLLVDGPVLTVSDSGKFNYGYDPNAVISLPGKGNVNPTMQVSDEWGTLKVEDGALLSSDFKNVMVAAPTSIAGPHIDGPGWVLDLQLGWRIVPAAKAGSYILERQ